MSLYKQLWAAVLLVMSVSFIASFIVSSLSAKDYLEQQLQLKNIDNANILAVTLSNSDFDPVTTTLMLTSIANSSHLQLLQLHSPTGELLEEFNDNAAIEGVPIWLTQLISIHTEPVTTQITRGWKQAGTITVQSHSKFAYQALWDKTQTLMGYFALIALLTGVIGSFVISIISRPLAAVVDQAAAISRREFIHTPEPKTLEFQAIVRSMNQLSGDVRTMLEQESQQLAQWQQQSQTDTVTGLLNREAFIDKFSALLEHKDEQSAGVVVLVRIMNLAQLNRSHGRVMMDDFLTALANTLRTQDHNRCDRIIGRLNGSDFISVITSDDKVEQIAQRLHQHILQLSQQWKLAEYCDFPCATAHYFANDQYTDIMTKLDNALITAELAAANHIQHGDTVEPSAVSSRRNHWQQLLETAFTYNQFALEHFPLRGSNNQLIHYEAPARLILEDGQQLTAGQFLPWVSRMGWGHRLDLIVSELAIGWINDMQQDVGVNLSADLLSNKDYIVALHKQLQPYSNLDKLWLEIPEYAVYNQFEQFSLLCKLLKPLGCKIGIEHVGQEISRIGLLADLGIHFIKIDSQLIHQIDSNHANQIVVQGLCGIVHSIGLKAYAEGVTTEAEWSMLKGLGINGGTGKYFS
ncbi:EAL domain-containing protein [Oceanicoccus sagamiensis]|uniref:GGDEF domain-containing protein n=1 Tax=Oceanicoccus sagamiensis TaxID=716816 RepID=A0A1X9NEM1_9GAMM|nr:EAL domain-containing protein [Oceanicoccus sagamiensis]ARN75504.1 hypothetical protein BST96_16130 [Oceanicoccus sagamiensis]